MATSGLSRTELRAGLAEAKRIISQAQHALDLSTPRARRYQREAGQEEWTHEESESLAQRRVWEAQRVLAGIAATRAF